MGEIIVLSNTIPVTYGQRQAAEQAVRRAIGARPGKWTVSLGEPQNATRWDIQIDGPNGFTRQWSFDGPGEQTAAFVESTIARDLSVNDGMN
jgi:hypothetical protein